MAVALEIRTRWPFNADSPKKIVCRQYADYRFFSTPGDNSDLHLAGLNVQNILSRIALCKNYLPTAVFLNSMARTGGAQKNVWIEVDNRFGFQVTLPAPALRRVPYYYHIKPRLSSRAGKPPCGIRAAVAADLGGDSALRLDDPELSKPPAPPPTRSSARRANPT